MVCDLNGKDLVEWIELKVVDVIEWMCAVLVVVSDLIGTALWVIVGLVAEILPQEQKPVVKHSIS